MNEGEKKKMIADMKTLAECLANNFAHITKVLTEEHNFSMAAAMAAAGQLTAIIFNGSLNKGKESMPDTVDEVIRKFGGMNNGDR